MVLISLAIFQSLSMFFVPPRTSTTNIKKFDLNHRPFLTTDYYWYRLKTPWKCIITAPRAAEMSLGSRFGSLACSWWYLFKLCSAILVKQPAANNHAFRYPSIRSRTKKYITLKVLQTNYIHLLRNIPNYFPLHFLQHISAQIKE